MKREARVDMRVLLLLLLLLGAQTSSFRDTKRVCVRADEKNRCVWGEKSCVRVCVCVCKYYIVGGDVRPDR